MRARLQRVLASAGLCSRREAEHWIAAGRVRVNGAVAEVGDSADPERDVVEVDGQRITGEPLVYWMAHKPRGLLTTLRDPEGRRTVLSLLPAGLPRVFPVGRLDADTEGLVLFTNDGALTHRLLHPSLGNEREYHVRVRGRVEPESLRRLEQGLILEDGPTAPARVAGVSFDANRGTTRFDLVLTEGRKRQIRRSLSELGHPVLELVRTRMGTLRLGTLARGEARPLAPRELAALRAHAAHLRPRPAPAPREGLVRRAPRPGRGAPRP
jgi:23S rRNA pseudouridine2605 synthase